MFLLGHLSHVSKELLVEYEELSSINLLINNIKAYQRFSWNFLYSKGFKLITEIARLAFFIYCTSGLHRIMYLGCNVM